MSRFPSFLSALLLAACGADRPGTGGVDGGSGRPGPSGAASPDGVGSAGPYQALGLNDATILAPLPADAAPVLLRGAELGDDGEAFVPRVLFDRLVEASSSAPIVFGDAYDRLHLVAVRLDLCDRNAPGPCPGNVDGSRERA